MRKTTFLILLFTFYFISSQVSGDETLPRVLILGDSVLLPPANEVAKLLKGKCEIVFPRMDADDVRDTTSALMHLDSLLNEQHWDLVYFNFGLSDLVYRAPGIKSFRALPKEAGGVRATSPEQYQKNLQALVERLKSSGAKLAWASTVPIKVDANGLFDQDSEIDYNSIAAKVMTEHNVPISDLHGYVEENMQGKKYPDPYSYARVVPLHQSIIDTIVNQLDLAEVK